MLADNAVYFYLAFWPTHRTNNLTLD